MEIIMKLNWLKQIALSGALLIAGAGIIGCESNAGTGALIGGATGAGVGGLIGSYSHARAGEGALIGGAIGAASGAPVGHAAHQQGRDAYRRQSEWRYEDYPVESRKYRYYRLEPAPPPLPVQYRYEYR